MKKEPIFFFENVTIKVFSLIIGNIEIIQKSSRKYLVIKPGNHDIKELQQTAALGAAHIQVLREALL